jgi:hypothetical protein
LSLGRKWPYRVRFGRTRREWRKRYSASFCTKPGYLKLARLREYHHDNRKLLEEKIDAAMAKAQVVYPRAHEAADAKLAEVEAIAAELDELEDDDNQAMGGNRPPQGGSGS